MIIVIFVITILLNLYFVFNNKKSDFAFVLLLFVCWFLFWGNNNNPDYEVYVYRYNTSIYIENLLAADFEPGFIFCMKIAKSSGLKYEHFLALYSLVGFILIGNSIWKYSNKANLILLIYSICQLAIDATQVRNFFAFTILIYSFRFLFDKKPLKYIICLIIGSLFHWEIVLYFPLVLLCIRNEKNTVKAKTVNKRYIYAFMVMIFIAFLSSLSSSLLENLKWLVLSFGISKAEYYLSTRARYGFLLYYLYQLIIVFIIRKRQDKATQPREKNMIVYRINIIMTYVLPLFTFNNNFLRVYRNIFIINCIILYSESDMKKINKVNMVNLIYLIYAFYLFIPGHVFTMFFKNQIFL